MNDEQYRDHCMALLANFGKTLTQRTADLPVNHSVRTLAAGFESLSDPSIDVYSRGPALIASLFNTFTELAPTLPRQLLWFFGGDCLHYLSDEEIDQFQQWEELREAAAQRGEIFNFENATAKALNLH